MALICLTVVFSTKTKVLLENNIKRELLSDIRTQSVSFEQNLKMVLASIKNHTIAWRDIDVNADALINYSTTIETHYKGYTVGILNIDGTAVFGDDINISDYPALKGAVQGHDGIDSVSDFNGIDEGVMFAAPIFREKNISSIIYVVIPMTQMLQFNTSNESEEYIYFATNELGEIVIPSKTTGVYLEFIVNMRENKDIDQQQLIAMMDIQQQLFNYNRGIVELMVGPDKYYFSIEGIPSTDFYVVSYIQKDVKYEYVDTILQLFLLVIGCLGILFVIIIGYVYIADEDSRSKVFVLAYKDALTGLYKNRWLPEYITTQHVSLDKIMISLFNIKNFKTVNALYGRKQGDALLQHIADELEALDWIDVAVRCDNDNFAIICTRMEFSAFKEKIQVFFQNIERNHCIEQKTTYYRCGVVYPTEQDGKTDINQYLDACRQATQLAKNINKSEVFCFDETLQQENDRIQQIKIDLDPALLNGEFEVFLQPKYEIVTDTIIGAEALIRWNYKHEGYILPFRFIPFFEEDGSIIKIDRFVFEMVCKTLSIWRAEGKKLLPISVNMSRIQMDNDGIVNEMQMIAQKYDIPPHYIEIEITESASFENIPILISKMVEIKQAGFPLSMDDFGTGYSSFSMLKDMPVDVLKIDKSFVDAMNDEKGRCIIADIINMAKHLGLKSLAEGVETQEDRDLLCEYGCDYIQGYFYNRPMSMDSYIKLLE